MTQHGTLSAVHHAHSAHPNIHSHAHPHPVKPGRRGKSSRRLSRLIVWEWGIVVALLAGLAGTLLFLTHGPDPRHQADALVAEMKSVLAGHKPGEILFGGHPVVSGGGREIAVTMSRVPPKVCVLAAWDLYRLGGISVNGVTPQRVSAARLVELCNDGETATIVWSPK